MTWRKSFSGLEASVIAKRYAKWFPGFIVLAFLALAGCATLTPDFETPEVSLVSLRPLPGDNLEQRFELGLNIKNPNRNDLPLVGLSYTVELDGYDLLSGVANNLPAIPAYGEARVDVSATVNLVEGIKLLSAVFATPKNELSYRISVKLDTGLPLLGRIPVTDAGVVSITQ